MNNKIIASIILGPSKFHPFHFYMSEGHNQADVMNCIKHLLEEGVIYKAAGVFGGYHKSPSCHKIFEYIIKTMEKKDELL